MTDTNKLQTENRKRFGTRAAGYRASAVHAGGADLDRLIALVAPTVKDRALDIATGAGHVAVALARAGARVTASDLTPGMLSEAADNFATHEVGAQLVLADALNLPFADNSFEIVTARMAPHHFPDPGKFVAEAARVLRPGGRFGLEDQVAPTHLAAAATINQFEFLRDPSHNRQLSAAEWESLAVAAGLTVEHSEVFEKQVEFDWWTSIQNATEEVRQTISALLANGPAEARDWYKPEFRDNGLIERFCSPHLILLATKPL
jgi:ubiquinone/menaquinone biosynthesis C-methylase UbiE